MNDLIVQTVKMVGKFRVPWSERENPSLVGTVEQVSISSISNTFSPSDGRHAEKYQEISDEAADVPKIAKSQYWDPNLPQETLNAIVEASKIGDPEKIHEVEVEFTEDSPYEQVRAAVRTTDGEEVANTVRAWVLGMIFVTIGSGMNCF